MEFIRSHRLALVFVAIFVLCNIYQIKNFVFPSEAGNIASYAVRDDFEYDLQVKDSRSKLMVDGWIFLPGRKVENFDVRVCLLAEDGRSILLNTNMVLRNDVEEHFADQIDKEQRLRYSGYVAAVYKAMLPKGEYQVALLYNCNGERAILRTDKRVEI